MRSDTIEPKTRTLHFEQTIFICARCECEYGRVYLYRGSWFCLLCLKDVLKDAGAKIYGSSWRPEAVRNAGEMKCLDVCVREFSGFARPCLPKNRAQAVFGLRD
jgi:hypothetical protein